MVRPMKARRVSIHEWKSVPAGTWDDHPSGDHMLVPVEVWLELERENRWMAAKIGDKEYDAMREAMIGGGDEV